MNIISTVGDLVKALSAYDQDLPIQVRDTHGNKFGFNNDTQLAHVHDSADYDHFEITLVGEDA